MADANLLVEALKKAAIKAVEARKPVNVYFGEVVGTSPLRINVEQKMTLGEKQLVLSRNVTDYKTSLTGAAGKMEVTVHNGLAAGDGVILARQQEGQKFIILDRVGA